MGAGLTSISIINKRKENTMNTNSSFSNLVSNLNNGNIATIEGVIAMNNMHIAESSNNSADFVPGTNITWSDAGAMHKDYLRDQRIERILNGSSKSPRRARKVVEVQPSMSLFEETGWSEADALDEVLETRRDARLFGKRRRCH
jgi:hypothetical protein